jgi:hypothetical protein
MQGLCVEDFPRRVQFCQWLLQRCLNQPHFVSQVLFTDEASFTRDGFFNCRNSHVWADENPHATVVANHQWRFAVNVWAGIIGDYVIGPYLLPPRLNGHIYRLFLEDVLPELLQDVPLIVRQQVWMQQDGAPAHFTLEVREHLDRAFHGRWIGRGGPVEWPARSPDLAPLDYFFWGHVKSLVYETPVDTPEELLARILAASDVVRETPGILERTRQNFVRRCNACIECEGRHFEHLL